VAAEDVSVQAHRDGDRVEVQAHATVAASRALVWQVLTDYESLPKFIPGITRSVVRERRAERMFVEQSGEARFLIFSFPIEVRLEVTENAPDSVVSRAVAGNLRRMDGRYDLSGEAAGVTQVRYRGVIEPSFSLPPLVGVAALRAMAEEQFTAMVQEIERRAAGAGK